MDDERREEFYDEQRIEQIDNRAVASRIDEQLQNIIPAPVDQGTRSLGETEKLARFFADLPMPEHAINNFYGFLNQATLYGFLQKEDTETLNVMLYQCMCNYKNSVPSWLWKREHSILLNNIRTQFFIIVRSAVGVKDNIQNARTSLNDINIKKQYSETLPKKRSWFGI